MKHNIPKVYTRRAAQRAAKPFQDGAKLSETINDSDVEPKATELLSQETTEPSTLFKELPVLEPIALQDSACDDNSGRLEMIKLYNRLRDLIESSAPDALQAHFGNNSAASNLSKNLQHVSTIYEDMHRVLAASDRTSTAESLDCKSANGHESSNKRPPSTVHTVPPKLSTASETENAHSEAVKMEDFDEESSNSQASVPQTIK